MSLGENLLNLRKRKNLSQEEVAEKLNVSRQTISKWETDQSTPDFDKISPLCDLYDISADELLSRKTKENKNDKESEDARKIKDAENQNSIRKAKGISLGILGYFISIVWIITSIPVFKINPILATGGFILICGIATYIIIYTSLVYKNKIIEKKRHEDKLLKDIENVLSLITCIIYIWISFLTMAWHITWLIWIIYALIIEIIKLIFTLKGISHEE